MLQALVSDAALCAWKLLRVSSACRPHTRKRHLCEAIHTCVTSSHCMPAALTVFGQVLLRAGKSPLVSVCFFGDPTLQLTSDGPADVPKGLHSDTLA